MNYEKTKGVLFMKHRVVVTAPSGAIYRTSTWTFRRNIDFFFFYHCCHRT